MKPSGWALLEKFTEEAAKWKICEEKNQCQCGGTCPGEPGWVPFPPKENEQESSRKDSDSDEAMACAGDPANPLWPLPGWSSENTDCYWDYSRAVPTAICP
jgi:hypothetical protein